MLSANSCRNACVCVLRVHTSHNNNNNYYYYLQPRARVVRVKAALHAVVDAAGDVAKGVQAVSEGRLCANNRKDAVEDAEHLFFLVSVIKRS